jgi:hypothetical protein
LNDRQKLLPGKQKENSQIFNEDFYLPLYLPLCIILITRTFLYTMYVPNIFGMYGK